MAWRKETLPVSRNEPLVAAEFAKGSFRCVGTDRDGRPVLLFAAHLNKFTAQAESRRVASVVRMIVCVLEEALASLPVRPRPGWFQTGLFGGMLTPSGFKRGSSVVC